MAESLQAELDRGGELRLLLGDHRPHRKHAGDSCALSFAARDAQAAAMQFDERTGDGKPKPASLMALGELVLDLLEGAAELGDVGFGNADAGVLDGDLHMTARARQLYLDAAAVASELHGIGQQIEEDLLQCATVRFERQMQG